MEDQPSVADLNTQTAADQDTFNQQAELKAAALLASTALLAACGGSNTTAQNDTGSNNTAMAAPPAPAPDPSAAAITAPEAARFLAQASMGASRAQIARVQSLGYAGWIDEQLSLPGNGTRWDWLVSKGFNDISYRNSQAGFDSTAWRKLISSPDTLRQRFTLVLSEIIVVSIDGLIGGGWKAFGAAGWLDMLEANCFGNYRDLLQMVSTSPAMGQYLTFRGNAKYNAQTGAMPDENYARELMQLFSIGLLELKLNGTPRQQDGKNIETYDLTDITGLARIFTGWDFDLAGGKADKPDFLHRPMTQVPVRHETGASTFLDKTVGEGLNGADALSAALDIIFAHDNVAPFISRQLIQRLVTSNPSTGYVSRVATVFNDDGSGTASKKGNLKAVLKAILLDDEARKPANLSDPQFGKLREPMLRFLAWARAYNVTATNDIWNLGNTSDPATRLGQSPLRSPSVFNYFRPGYVPPNTAIAAASLVAPEFQITNESSVVGYVNYMQRAISSGISDLVPDYSSLMPLADTASAMLDEINLVLAAGQLSTVTLQNLSTAVDSMPRGTDTRRKQRIYAALTLVLAAPEFIVLK
ncbi:hypothetical protein UNDYM_5447 [Undibacterium sp. YM2]|uniref:DUF1800 domain-containing protein n=1 Tax=Undibacterium sp. YM2 TaxID=2058625 RepID=UPI001331CE3A|nr:DUF1800 domain-containing protein [Undibacterium sp. YM2]BBB69700.1 hypothetical protein UNDYM_5447 [Undibacterium sp. YM2]